MSYLSKNLRFLRKSFGFSQNYISDLLGYKTFTTIQKWESGNSEPSISIVTKLADLYNVSLNELIYKNLELENNETDISNNINNKINKYKYFDVGIAAGLLESIEAKTKPDDYIELSNKIMGKYAGKESIIVLRLNGESMNKIIPNGSYIVVDTDKKSITDINNKDIIVFSENGEYSVKKYYNDTINERFLFIPQSYEEIFTPIEIKYENSSNLKLIGKVVKYIVELS